MGYRLLERCAHTMVQLEKRTRRTNYSDKERKQKEEIEQNLASFDQSWEARASILPRNPWTLVYGSCRRQGTQIPMDRGRQLE
jgi:hypothetical protein